MDDKDLLGFQVISIILYFFIFGIDGNGMEVHVSIGSFRNSILTDSAIILSTTYLEILIIKQGVFTESVQFIQFSPIRRVRLN